MSCLHSLAVKRRLWGACGPTTVGGLGWAECPSRPTGPGGMLSRVAVPIVRREQLVVRLGCGEFTVPILERALDEPWIRYAGMILGAQRHNFERVRPYTSLADPLVEKRVLERCDGRWSVNGMVFHILFAVSRRTKNVAGCVTPLHDPDAL